MPLLPACSNDLHTSDGQFVNSVEVWVELFNAAIENGTCPKGENWLEIWIAQYNKNYRAEVVSVVKVRPCKDFPKRPEVFPIVTSLHYNDAPWLSWFVTFFCRFESVRV